MYYEVNSNGRTKVRKCFLMWLFVLTIVLTIAAGTAAGKEAGKVEVDVSGKETISLLTFEKDRTITDALLILGEMFKKNIVPTTEVKGVLGFQRLRNVTFEEAMEAILGKNFKYEQKGNLVKVYAKEDTARMSQEIFTLYYVNAAEMEQLIHTKSY